MNPMRSRIHVLVVVTTLMNGSLVCHAATRTWSGAVDGLWSTAGNWQGGVPGSGDALLFPSGAANRANTNDLPPDDVYESLVFLGAGYTIGGNAIGLSGGISTASGVFGNRIDAPLRLEASQTIVGGSTILGGAIDLGANDLSFDGVVQVDGVISGSGGVHVISGGVLTLNADNLYTGPTTVRGALTVNGNQPLSALSVNSSASLGGSGTLGSVIGGPGTTTRVTPHGVLSMADFSATSGTLTVSLDGPLVGSDYDQLNVSGTVSFGSGFGLDVSVGYAPVVGQQFIIIDNDGTAPINGALADLSEGATIDLSGTKLQLSYVGGDGNDVVLVALTGAGEPSPTPTSTSSPILTPSSTPTPPPTATPPGCLGDCSGDGEVTIDELVLMVNIALEAADVSACQVGDGNRDGQISVDEIIAAVNIALDRCANAERSRSSARD